MNRKVVTLRLTAVLLLLCGLTTAVFLHQQPSQTAQAQTPATYRTSNGITVQAAMPIPAFQFLPPQVSADGSVRPLGGRFSAIGRAGDIDQTPYLNQPRYTMVNTDTGAILEQYGATGGFYAYNPTEAFGEESRGDIDPVLAQRHACNVLYGYNGMLFPDDDLISTPEVFWCDYEFEKNPYKTNLIQGSAADAAGRTIGSVETLGIIVQVPLSLNTGRYVQEPSNVPIGGAGGHISMLFRTTEEIQPTQANAVFSLDESVPGLAAIAMPFYSRELQHLGNFAMRDMAEVQAEVRQQVEETYPTASQITVTAPALIYTVGDAAQVQTVLEPVFDFGGIEVVVDGETIILRNIEIPAIEDPTFGPDVAILSPAEGSYFAPDTAVSLLGNISGGTAPYTYSWSIDGAVIVTGTLPSAGDVNATASDLGLDSRSFVPSPINVILEAQDSDGITRYALITLFQEPMGEIYLPAVLSNNSEVSGDMGAYQYDMLAPTAVYHYGTHAGSDYPPYGAGGSDLPGVIPDVNGFRSSMSSYGWTSRYNYWNVNAWEKDWRDCSLGGVDCTDGVDRVAFAYYAGHGGPGGLSMPNKTKDSGWFDGANARYSTLRWAGFASCQTLRVQGYSSGNEPIRRWFGAFQGAHMLMGFNSNMKDVAFGPRLVDNMRPVTMFGIVLYQRSIREAWVHTAFNMNAGKPAYIYAKSASVNPENNKLPRTSDPMPARPFPAVSYHWVWWDE
jgi:hypothetical protein